MLSKKEIETCKQELNNYIEFMETAGDNAGWARGMKWYIEQIEVDNYEANKRIDEYIEDRQKLIEKLETNIEELEILNDNYIDGNVIEGTYETLGRISEDRRILEFVKGEKK